MKEKLMREAKRINMTKMFVMLLAFVLVAGASVAGTLAWLSAETTEVTNTFTSAELFANPKTQFTLWEHEATDEDKDGRYTLDKSNEVLGNTYDILPGVNIPKDPTVDIENLKENAYLYIKVTESLPNDLSYSIDSNNWDKLDEKYPGVWIYKGDKAVNNVISASDDSKQTFLVNVLTQIQDSTYGNYAITVAPNYEGNNNAITLTFDAYMVQATGNGANAKEAWGNTYGAVTTGN